jgi:hypothetical protein
MRWTVRAGYMSHKSVQRVDFADQCTLAYASNGRVARQFAYRVDILRQQKRSRAGTRSPCGSLASGVPSSNNAD